MTRASNHRMAGGRFRCRFGRWPLPPHDPAATINDVIFARMIDPLWSPLQRAFVDKATAKIEAKRLAPNLHIPETLSIVPMAAVPAVGDLYRRLAPFVGRDAIAKPAHASGGATFLRTVTSADDLRGLHDLGSADYACVMREMQYWRLPRTIIVEATIPSPRDGPPDDYKFHCVHGEPLLCQIDHDRFGRPWSRLFHIPGFAPMDPDDGLAEPPGHVPPARARLESMAAAARALAAPFDFVRVDLYDGGDGIYFGELTFTPGASLGIAPSSAGDHAMNATHRIYSRILMEALRRTGHAADGPGRQPCGHGDPAAALAAS